MLRHRYGEDAPIGDALATAIGHLVQQWGHLEDNAIFLTALLHNADPFHFRAVGVNLPTRSKFEALAATAQRTLTSRKARTIVEIAERAIRLTAERNRIIHGSWYPTQNPDVAERYTYGARGTLLRKAEQVSAARVRGFTGEVARLRRRFNHAISRTGWYRPRVPSPPP
jgi:hypothetical protein